MTNDAHSPLAVIVVGLGTRAQAWTRVVTRSPRLRLAATLAGLDGLAKALAQHPHAAVAGVVGPAAASRVAEMLAGARRSGVVQAPLAAAPSGTWDGVRVAYGWCSLPGAQWFARVTEARPPRRVSIRVSGAPESAGAGLDVVLPHALALVQWWFPHASVRATANRGDHEVSVQFDAAGTTVSLVARAGPRSLSATAETARGEVRLDWRPDVEHRTVERSGKTEVTEVSTRSAEERALAQLLGGALGGAGLDAAAEVQRLYDVVRRELPLVSVSHRRLRVCASALARDGSIGAALGLRGVVAAEKGPVGEMASPRQRPVEIRALRAGCARAVFLTVAPDEVDATMALLDGLCVQSRERRVDVAAQDRWNDQRDAGRPMVEIYAAADAARVAQLVALQAQGDPTAHVGAIGALLGYPDCCIAAFAAQSDRANNTYNRYATFARTASDGPWPWQLNNFVTMTVPFFPCRYDCDAAAAYAARVVDPAAETRLRGVALYFTHELQLHLHGTGNREQAGYQSVAVPGWVDPLLMPLAHQLAAGSRISLDSRALTLLDKGTAIATFERTDPALGFLAAFA